ncbi:MAG: SLC13 family permease [Planctomycetota bacterium]
MQDWQFWSAIAIFLFCYVVIAFQQIPRLRIDRPGGTLIAATLMVLVGVLTFEEAWDAVDPHTIVLLLGMMILNVFLEESGFFGLATAFVLRRARSPLQLLVGLSFLSGILSALFLNDTICLMLCPPLLSILRRAKLPYPPYLVALAMSANVGSVMTITGNPQNMLIGVFGRWSYLHFLLRMLPVGLLGLGVMTAILAVLYRKELNRPAHWANDLPDGDMDKVGELPVDRTLLVKSLVVIAVVLLGFIVTGDLPMTSIAGSAALIVWSRQPPARILKQVDWVLLLFFSGLFIVVAGIGKTGIINDMDRLARPLYGTTVWTQIPTFSLVTVVVSNVVSNVPFVLLAHQFIDGFADPPTMWLVLAMASTFAGNLTIPGSVATLIVLETCKGEASIGFLEFLKAGIPITIATTLLGALVLAMQYYFLAMP